MIRRPPRSTLSLHDALPILVLAVGALRYRPGAQLWATGVMIAGLVLVVVAFHGRIFLPPADAAAFAANSVALDLDRKSTRLNSSHANISSVVFCLTT